MIILGFSNNLFMMLITQLGSAYGGNSAGGPDSAARHLAMLGASQDGEIGGYRSHTSSAASNYGGHFNSVYGSAGLSSSQQVDHIPIHMLFNLYPVHWHHAFLLF